MTDAKRVLLPREATEEMERAGTEARWRSAVRSPDNTLEIYAAMRDASPNAGCVSEEEVEKAAAAAYENYSGHSFDSAPEFHRTAFIDMQRAALSSLGLEVEG